MSATRARLRAALALLAILAGFAVRNPAVAEGDPPRPSFEARACDLPDVPLAILPRLRCGTVAVPRSYAAPLAGRFALAVVVVKSTTQPARPDPIIYISGGPGAPLTVYTAYQAQHPYAQDRDLILVDQRATGRSEPALCPDARQGLVDSTLGVAVAATTATRFEHRAAILACRDQAIARGLDLGDFGTTVTVEDLEAVRQALGVALWNVVGESYGTTVAMTLMARHPSTIRSAVLDSLNPPDPGPLWSANVAAARDSFFASCADDAACAGAYPDLAGVYRATLDGLRHHPLSVAVPPEMHRPGDRVPLTSALFEIIVARRLYYPPNYAGLPGLIASLHAGDTAPFAQALASVIEEAETANQADFTAVECRDRPRYRHALDEPGAALDETQLYGICDGWSTLGPPPAIPVSTTVPTLVLAGQFDPNVTPATSREVAALIGPRATWIEFPRVGHSVRHFSPCATGLVAAFIDRPARPLDGSCVDRRPRIAFPSRAGVAR